MGGVGETWGHKELSLPLDYTDNDLKRFMYAEPLKNTDEIHEVFRTHHITDDLRASASVKEINIVSQDLFSDPIMEKLARAKPRSGERRVSLTLYCVAFISMSAFIVISLNPPYNWILAMVVLTPIIILAISRDKYGPANRQRNKR